MKKNFDQKIIMRIEMVILIVITIIAITLAWFVVINRSTVNGMQLTAYDDQFLRVAIEQGGEDVNTLTASGNTVVADVQLPYFKNIHEKDSDKKQMAPGVYGQIDLYITALSPLAKQCTVSINSVPEYIDAVAADDTRREKTDSLLKGHIQFYAERDDNNKGTAYSKLITADEPLLVDLQQGVEKKVTIYWIWFYEYSDIPDEGRQFQADNYFESSVTGDYDPSVSANDIQLEEYMSEYDQGDTWIGLTVENLGFRLYVDPTFDTSPEALPGAGLDAEDLPEAGAASDTDGGIACIRNPKTIT